MRAKRVGVSLVSAITHTPASGPFGPLTTPPISVAPILTPGGACWAESSAGTTANNAAASTSGAALNKNLPLILMVHAPLINVILGVMSRCIGLVGSIRCVCAATDSTVRGFSIALGHWVPPVRPLPAAGATSAALVRVSLGARRLARLASAVRPRLDHRRPLGGAGLHETFDRGFGEAVALTSQLQARGNLLCRRAAEIGQRQQAGNQSREAMHG